MPIIYSQPAMDTATYPVLKTDLSDECIQAVESAMIATGITTTDGLETVPQAVQAALDKYDLEGYTMATRNRSD